jgi:sterol desaturase/sphingolipid hydroxylase (fatty acid hydroxylase superfamily)
MAVFIIYSIGNTIGHLGYELSTQNMNKMLDKIFINSIHHNMHHKYGYLNYGLYFPFWDKVMNTFHHKYKEERESFYKNKNGN